MDDQFEDILEIEGVKKVLLLSSDGAILYQSPGGGPNSRELAAEWPHVRKIFERLREADLIFARVRVYVRKTTAGYLVIPMSLDGPAAKIRLTCDLIQARMGQRSAKGFKRFLRPWKKSAPNTGGR